MPHTGQVVISIIFFLLSMVAVAHESIDIKQFNLVTEQVKELKKTDLVLSLKQLTTFENVLSSLTVEQNLLYFKLLAEIQIGQNKYSAAKKTANEGLNIGKRLASPSILMSELLYLRGFAFESLGDIPRATKEYKSGLEVAESLHNKIQIAVGLINLGAIAYLTDDYKRSLILLNDAYNIAGQTDDEELKGTANTELGIVYAHLRQDEQSMAYYQQSYTHFKKAGLLLAAHNSLHNIAISHTRKKNYDQAITVFKTLITESNKDTPSDSMFTVYSGMAWAHLKKIDSNPDAAYEYLLMAKPYLQSTEKIDHQLGFYFDEANILYKLGRFDEALDSITRIEAILVNHQELPRRKRKGYVNIINLKAKVFYKQEKYQQAYETKSRVITLTDKLYENEDNRSIARVRLELEAEQADKKNEILSNQKIRYEASFNEAKLESDTQKIYLIISALLALAFAWVLVKLIQSQHKLKIALNVDKLTGTANRHRLMLKSQQAFELAKVKQTHLSLLMIDIDNLKDINDRLGHSIGDEILTKVAFIGADMMRKNDIFGRFSGEEFMMCLPKASLKSAMETGECIRACINEHIWQFNPLEKVSVSVGVATLTDDTDLISLVRKAEDQLYQAKASGRNKVCG
jgi:diguanylate cyclase (GGDEF)-like protein